ncbi:MAG: transposase DNA-binding-containing protein, partial [Verrucomicrobiota bacterium]
MPGAPLTDPGVRFDRTGLFKVGDRRRTQRLVTVTTALAQNPNGTLPTTFTNWKDLRAAYRLFAETDVT